MLKMVLSQLQQNRDFEKLLIGIVSAESVWYTFRRLISVLDTALPKNTLAGQFQQTQNTI